MQYKPTGELQAEAERLAAQAKAAREAGEDPMAPLVEAALKKPAAGAPPSPRTAMAPGTPVAASGANIGAVAGAGGAPPSAFSGSGTEQRRSQPPTAGAEEEPSFHEPYSRDIHHGEHMFPGVKGHETEEFERSESYASPDDVRPEIKAAVERHERQGWTPEELERFHAAGERHTHAQAQMERRGLGATAGVTQTAGAAAGAAMETAHRTKEAAMETGGAAMEGAKGVAARGTEKAVESGATAVEGAKGMAQGAAETVGAATETAKGAAQRTAQAADETAGAAAQSVKETAGAAAETAAGAAQRTKEAAAETAGAAAERTKAAAAGAAETATATAQRAKETASETAAEAGRRTQGVVAQAREAVASAVRVTVERLSHAVGAAKERVGIPAEQPMTEAAREKAEAALAAAKHRAGVPEEQPLGEAAREAGHSAAEAARARAAGLAHTVKDKVAQVPVQMREMYAHGKALAQEKDAARGRGVAGAPEAQAAQRKAYTEGASEGGQRPGGSIETEGGGAAEEHHPSYAPHFQLPMPPQMVDQSMAGKVSESHVEGGGQLPHQGAQRGGAEVVDESGRQSLGVEE